jgi:hypothetical protein
LRGLDLAPLQIWEATELHVADDAYVVEIAWTPMDDAWDDLAADDAARIFWQESLPAYLDGYYDRLAVTLLADRRSGDTTTRIDVRLR